MVLFMQMYYTVDTVAEQRHAYLHAVTSFSLKQNNKFFVIIRLVILSYPTDTV